MSLILTNNKTLKGIALITINGCLEPTDISTKGDITIIKNNNEIIGVNVNNYSKYFSANEGMHSLSERQARFFKSNKIDFDYSSRIIVGEILEIKNHPKSEKLKVIRARADKERTFVTNIQGLDVHEKILIALTGTTLPNGLTIKKGSIAGTESNVAITTKKSLLTKDEPKINNLAVGTPFTF